MRTPSLAVAALCALAPFAQDPQPAATAIPQSPVARPADVASPDAAVTALYEVISGPAGQARDWDRLRSLFHADAKLVPMLKGKNGMRAVTITVDDYVQRSGPMLERDGFFEQPIANRTDVFGDMAHVFSTYEGRKQKTDKAPFLRGINSFQLVREGGRWWILHVLWEQEHDAGPIPAQYLPAHAERPPAPAPNLLQVSGSDLLLEVAQLWAESYHEVAPDVGIAVTGGGTSMGIQKLATGAAQLAMGARRMSEPEIAAVRASGFEPKELHVADLALAICVAAGNPIRSLTLEQLAAIYREGGAITKWSQLGVKMADGVDDAIVPVERFSNSGTYEQFRLLVLGQANSRAGSNALNGNKDIVAFVTGHAGAIAYCPSTQHGDLRAVAIAAKQGSAAVPPTDAAVRDGSYPLTRPLYLYFHDEPSGTVKAFAEWIQGPAGRAIVQRAGFVPMAR